MPPYNAVKGEQARKTLLLRAFWDIISYIYLRGNRSGDARFSVFAGAFNGTVSVKSNGVKNMGSFDLFGGAIMTNKMKWAGRVVFALFLMLAFFPVSGKNIYADSRIWQEIDMSPGETYDVTEAKKNTTVFINRDGDYTFRGQSSYVRIVVNSRAANLYFEDGLSLVCDVNTYAGAATSPVTVGEQGGTVRLISKKNAGVYLKGYKAPGIRKDGTVTALVFETEDPDAPGTIEAAAGQNAAGIGNPGSLGGITGNITINGGNITARGMNDGAGIGGGAGSGVKGLYIKGGTVTAVSNGAGAAIGGGGECSGKSIVITGGEIHVNNTGSGVGIGSGTGKSISPETDISISGGRIYASGGDGAPAIGCAGGDRDHPAKSDIVISGGTVTAEKGSGKNKDNEYDIGSRGYEDDAVKVTISGGSVYADKIFNACDEKGREAHRIDLSFDGIDKDGIPVAEPVIPEYFSGTYGMKDVYTDHGAKIFPWFYGEEGNPETPVLKQLSVGAALSDGGIPCFGNISLSESEGRFSAPAKLELKPLLPAAGCSAGTAYVSDGEKKIYISKAPSVPKGYDIGNYLIAEDMIVADKEGNLKPDVIDMPDPSDMDSWTLYTDANGRWTAGAGDRTLYYSHPGQSFGIIYDPNAPENAGTEISGNMADAEVTFGDDVMIAQNAYLLPGYEFKGWNTKPDGSGSSYAQGSKADNLFKASEASVTLYAQWKPLTYDIVLESEDPDETETIRNVKFDQDVRITPVSGLGWSEEGYYFHGFRRKGAPSSFYPDGAAVRNLCSIEDDGSIRGYTLTAVWKHGDGKSLTIYTTENGNGVDVLADGGSFRIRAGGENGESEALMTDQVVTGTYEADISGLSAGTYVLSVDSEDYEIPEGKNTFTVKEGEQASLVFEWYSVDITGDTGTDECFVLSEKDQTKHSRLDHVPKDAEIRVAVTAKEGYGFSGYSVSGMAPGNLNETKEGIQTVKVRGQAHLFVHTAPFEYEIRFDKNGGNSIRGTMKARKMAFDAGGVLDRNCYERDGGRFAGWNTKADGTGDDYADGAYISLPVTADNEVITLYALWDMEEYTLDYDLGGGSLPAGKSNPDKYTADKEIILNAPERADHRFTGWTGEGIFVPDPALKIPEGSTGNRTYKAVYDPIQYTVTFDSRYGTGIDPQVINTGDRSKRPKDPERTGFDFGGWYQEAACRKKYDFKTPVAGDITLYAKWTGAKDPVNEETSENESGSGGSSQGNPAAKPTTFMIVYDLAGGNMNGQTGYLADMFKYDDNIVLRDAPQRQGYSFEYWQVGSSPVIYRPGDTYKVTDNCVFTAVWKELPVQDKEENSPQESDKEKENKDEKKADKENEQKDDETGVKGSGINENAAAPDIKGDDEKSSPGDKILLINNGTESKGKDKDKEDKGLVPIIVAMVVTLAGILILAGLFIYSRHVGKKMASAEEDEGEDEEYLDEDIDFDEEEDK